MKRIYTTFLILTVCVAQAQNQASVTKNVKYTLAQDLIKQRVVNGSTVEEVISSPKTVLPGDLLREEVSLANISGKNLTKTTISVPVPKATEFIGNVTPNTERWTAQYSVDGGKNYSASPQRTVTVTENGKSIIKQVAAPLNSYTNVRWTVATIKLGETLKLSFRVKVK